MTTNRTAREIIAPELEEILLALIRIVKSDEMPASSRVAAAKELLDRHDGRPRQTVENIVKDESRNKYSDIVHKIRIEQLSLLPDGANE